MPVQGYRAEESELLLRTFQELDQHARAFVRIFGTAVHKIDWRFSYCFEKRRLQLPAMRPDNFVGC